MIRERNQSYENNNLPSLNQRPALLDLLLELHRACIMTHDEVRQQVDTFMFEVNTYIR